MDSLIVKWLNGGVGHFRPWDLFMEAVVSDYLVPVLGSLVLVGLWFWGDEKDRFRNQTGFLIGSIAMGFSNLSTIIINNAYFRARPFVDHDLDLLFYRPTDSSFPSNPAAVGFAVATGVFLANRRMGLVMYGVAFLYGFARVYSGVQYPSDILAGASIGIVIGLLVWGGLRLLRPVVRVVLRGAQAVYLA